MQGADPFDEVEFFTAVAASGARCLLIGRRALIVLGYPVMTADYDFWIHADDVAAMNAAVARFGLLPSRTPEDVKQFGRYVLENSERVDVLAARAVHTFDGERVDFDDVWSRRQTVDYKGVAATLPSVADLIRTKRFAARPKDAEDIRVLTRMLERGSR